MNAFEFNVNWKNRGAIGMDPTIRLYIKVPFKLSVDSNAFICGMSFSVGG